MRIGEIARVVGVTTRAIRHYHHLGLLPEPERRPNGYRDYGVRDALALARIRRLTELGLGLDEVRDVLADDAGRELAEVLGELDEDLARQERAIQERRERLRVLLEEARDGRLPADGPVSPGLAELLGAFGSTDSPTAAKDREHLTLLDTAADPEQRDRLYAALAPLAENPELTARFGELYRRLDELADADSRDPRVAALGAELAASVPDGLLGVIGQEEGVREGLESGFGEAFLADFAPAQAAAVRIMLDALAARLRERP
ncbi:MerR family transcriptional regulator [Streptomyces sp. NPDC059009]|uniref:MerR family transcriptional regulator n=1 Tax=Streptomyces sp. NPDC059009 TaxID=3346694 RepID=UPI003681B33C